MDILSRDMLDLLRYDAVREGVERLHADPYLGEVEVTLPTGRVLILRRVGGPLVRRSAEMGQ